MHVTCKVSRTDAKTITADSEVVTENGPPYVRVTAADRSLPHCTGTPRAASDSGHEKEEDDV